MGYAPHPQAWPAPTPAGSAAPPPTFIPAAPPGGGFRLLESLGSPAGQAPSLPPAGGERASTGGTYATLLAGALAPPATAAQAPAGAMPAGPSPGGPPVWSAPPAGPIGMSLGAPPNAAPGRAASLLGAAAVTIPLAEVLRMVAFGAPTASPAHDAFRAAMRAPAPR